MGPPDDGITQAVFGNASDMLLASSWDKSVRLYDARSNAFRYKYEHKGAVMDVCFNEDDSKAFSGGVDKALVSVDLKTGVLTTLGSHEGTIRAINYSTSIGQVFTGSWDCNVCAWDPRSPKPLQGTYTISEGGKVYTQSLVGTKLVVGTSNRQVSIYDVRRMSSPEQVRESSLAHQTRCVRIFPDCTGYSLSSIEGRVAIEFFDPSPEVQAKKYAFKCHRKQVGTKQMLYPVNAMAFHPGYGTFATGGCDGIVNVWDGKNKKRICQYPVYPTSVASLNFNRDGTLLAVAASYTFEEGDKEHPRDAIYIRNVNDSDVRPKTAAPKA